MKKQPYLLNMLLAAVVVVLCVAVKLTDVFAPYAVLPHISIPLMVLVTVVALAIEYYVAAPKKREWIGTVIMGGLTFAMLPVCAKVNGDLSFWKLLLWGTVVFTVTTILYTSMGKRMSGGAKAKAAPAIHGLLLFLAAQFFQGIL